MKNRKKKLRKALLLVCSAAVLVCLSVGATVAYLTAEKSVVNTFTFGQVGIKLDEIKVDEYGTAVSGAEGGRKEAGNEYKLIPGHTYTKDPTVTVLADSEESYIRMLVKVNDHADLKTVFGTNAELWDSTGDYLRLEKFVQNWDSNIWESHKVSVDQTADVATYEFRYYTTVSTVDAEAKLLEPLFVSFKLPESLANEDVAKMGGLKIDVVAHAIQADTFEDENKAWEAFDAQKTNP